MNAIPIAGPGINADSIVTNRKDSSPPGICNMLGKMRDAVYS